MSVFSKSIFKVSLILSLLPASSLASPSDSLLVAAKDKLETNVANLAKAVRKQLDADAKKSSDELEGQIVKVYMDTEQYCAVRLSLLNIQKATDDKKGAHVNAWGGLLALIGGVTVYAPAKAVLMGVGISSSGGSGSVLGGMAGSLEKDSKDVSAEISGLRKSYASAIENYEKISEDPSGSKRLNALTRVQAACDGLMSISTQ